MQVSHSINANDPDTKTPRFKYLQEKLGGLGDGKLTHEASIPLVTYYKEGELAETATMFDEFDVGKKTEEVKEGELYYPHLKPELACYLIFDDYVYSP